MKKHKITKAKVELAIKNILEYIGENPLREGLNKTPQRVINSYKKMFKGYKECPKDILSNVLYEFQDYNDIILVKNILVESYCEHHMVPITGKAHVAYLPNKKIVGISKIAKIVEIFSQRLQIQERITVQIASSIYNILKPQGVAVIIKSHHKCMSIKNIKLENTSVITNCMKGIFDTDINKRKELYTLLTI